MKRFAVCCACLIAASLIAAPAFGQKKLDQKRVDAIDQAMPAKAAAKPKQPRKLLIYTRANGFVHSSIPYGAYAVKQLGEKTGAFTGVISDDPEQFSPQNLKQYDAVCLVNTTGDWLQDKAAMKAASGDEKKKLQAREEELKQSLLSWLEAGGGLAGFHAASDSYYRWPEFGKIIGGYFAGHPWHEKVMIKVEDKSHRLTDTFDETGDFFITDEIYQFKDPYARDNLRILLTLDLERSPTNKKGNRQDNDYAVAWVNTHGKGRVFYSSLGHREEIYYNPQMLKFYLDGLQFVMGDIDAATTPSSETAAAASSGDKKGDWQVLFDGKNLDNWTHKDDGWKVEEGTAALQQGGGYLWSKKQYENFVLTGEFKMAKGCNSGIFFRTDPKNPVQGGFEIQILDSHGKSNVGKHDAGALYDAKPPSENAVKPAGEWNNFTLTCDGPKIKFELNGKTVIDVSIDDWKEGNKNPDGSRNKFKTALKDMPRTGHIGFQDHGKPVWIRNVKIKPLK